MRAVVLVGGEGTRLRPLTYTTPKPLLPIANQPFLERQLSWLGRHGVDEVVLSMGYLPDAFEEHFPTGRFGDVAVRYAVEREPLGTGGAIRFAASEVKERFVVCNGDVLTTLDLAALVRFHDERGAEATLHLTAVEDPSAFGVVPTDEDGAVQAFVEKPPLDEAPTNWINAGTYVLEPSALQAIAPGANVSIEREVFPALVADARRVFALRSHDYWLDIGTPASYLQAHADVLTGALGLPPVEGVSEHAPGVWVGEDAEIADAVVVAPALIGAGARLAAGAHVEASTVGPGGEVGPDAKVVGSVLGTRARVGRGTQVSDSVVGPDAVLEPEVTVTDLSIVGAGATVTGGAEMAAARVHVPRRP